jgi:glycosyltransferase involved in cell wall biosynthesis
MVRFGHDPSIVHTVPNPVDVPSYQAALGNRAQVREAYGLEPDHVVFGIFGRITPWKGQFEFIEGVSGLLGRYPNLRIMIVGDASDTDDKGYIDRVRALARTPTYDKKVIMTGYQASVPDFYAAADVVVHNSTTPEPFGRVVIEGMASGRPVVAMKEGGPMDIITDGVDGLLVEPRKPGALAQALEILHLNPELRANLGRKGLKTVIENHNARVIAERVLELYT